jgi:hypothetical protein
LQVAGIAARPYIKWQKADNGAARYHAVVLLPSGKVEDPSLALGMGGAPVTRLATFIDP